MNDKNKPTKGETEYNIFEEKDVKPMESRLLLIIVLSDNLMFDILMEICCKSRTWYVINLIPGNW